MTGGATFVPEVDYVHKVGCVEWVNGLDQIFPEGFLPEKRYTFEEGGKTYIPPEPGRFTGTYITGSDCDLKRINLSFSAYNLEDTYDILIGDRYLVRNAPTIEMAETKNLDLHEKADTGTPIIIVFHNNSATEKYMFYSVTVFTDFEYRENLITFPWYFNWSGYSTMLVEQHMHTEEFQLPKEYADGYHFDRIEMTVTSFQEHKLLAKVTWSAKTGLKTTYVENDQAYIGESPLARDRTILFTDVQVMGSIVRLVFRNLGDTDFGVNDSRIGMNIKAITYSLIN